MLNVKITARWLIDLIGDITLDTSFGVGREQFVIAVFGLSLSKMLPQPKYLIFITRLVAGAFQLTAQAFRKGQRNVKPDQLGFDTASADLFMQYEVSRKIAFALDTI